MVRDERRAGLRAGLGEVGGDAAGHDAVHHQPVAEAGVGDAQHVLAQDAAVGVHEREGGVVADGADVAEVVGEALQLGHQRAQPDRARRRLDAERRLDGAGEGEGVGDGAVAGDAAGEPAPPARAAAPSIRPSMPLCT